MDELVFSFDKKSGRLSIGGPLTMAHAARAEKRLRSKNIRSIDISQLTALDTAGALLLIDRDLPVSGASDAHTALLEMIDRLPVKLPKEPPVKPWLYRSVLGLGRYADHLKRESAEVVTFIGRAAVALAQACRHPHRIRFASVAHHIESIGISALPIIGLVAFLISIVLAYQGVAQLRPYGGERFTVNLVAISILREMGVLLTAIMVAGRSGSAFTAEIGVMKAREEVDALEVLGIRPFDMLVVPRLIAIIVALPLLTFFANMMGLVGGFFIIRSLIDIHLQEYVQQIHLAAQIEDLFVGMIKAPVFAFVIGVVGCMHGLRVSGSAESIGEETTASVVKSIFLVLTLDGLFSILFEKLGI